MNISLPQDIQSFQLTHKPDTRCCNRVKRYFQFLILFADALGLKLILKDECDCVFTMFLSIIQLTKVYKILNPIVLLHCNTET